MDIYRTIKNNSRKTFNRVAFFMGFPNFALVQNLSFYFLILYLYHSFRLPYKAFKVRGIMGIGAVLFSIGAFFSTISAGLYLGYDYFVYAINVLPNYVYWSFLIIVLGNLALKTNSILEISKMVFYGLILFCVSRYFFASLFSLIPIYRSFPQNAFAFCLIIFNPLAIAYVQHEYKSNIITLIFIVLFTLAGFASGSRAGSLLVLGGGISVFMLASWQRLIVLTFSAVLLYFIVPQLLELEDVKNTIYKLNSRTYEFIYEREEVLVSDRSYLTRIAMIEKGLTLFEEHPVAGIGIGNFSRTQVDIDFDFEGGQFLANREEDLEMRTNPHNSYISFLSEGGLLLFIPAVLLMYFPIFYFITHFNNIDNIEKGLFIGVIYMCIHSFAITGMVNVYGWFLLALCNAYILKIKDETREARILLSQQLRNQFR